ncbi:MAG: PAS domain S-box protein [Candidatus Thorarchaeota archaeon]
MSDDGKTITKVRTAGIRYEALFENTNDAVFLIDLEGRHFNANKQASKMLGYKHEDLIGMSVWDVIAEGEKGKAEGILEKLLEGRQVPPYERVFRTADGTDFPVEINVTLVRDSEGNPEYIQSIVRNISARQEFQEALKISEKRHRDLITNLPEGIASVDFDENFTFVNQAFCEMLGYSPDELLRMSAFELLDSENKSVLQQQTEHRKKGESSSYELGLIRKDGKRIVARISAVPQTNDAGEISGTISVVSDVTAKNSAEAALAASEVRFRAVFDQAAVGVAIASPDGNLLRTNRALEKTLGYESGEMIGTNVFDIASPEDHDHIIAQNREILAGIRESYQLETKFRRRDGELVWGRLVVSIPPKVEGSELFAIGIFEDISKEKTADEALRASEARFRLVFEQAALGVSVVASDNTITRANPTLESMLGYGTGELEGIKIRDITHPEDVHIDAKFAEEIRGRRRDRYQIEKRYVKKDGQIMWGRLTVSITPLNGVSEPFVIGLVEDITRAKQAEDELSKSEARFRSVFENAAFGMTIVDADDNLLGANAGFLELTGYSLSELQGMKIAKYTHPDDAEIDAKLFKEIKEGNRDSYQMEKRYIRKDGSVVIGNLTVSTVRNEQGDIVLTTGMVEDITERKQAEEELRKLSRAIERSPASVVITDVNGLIEYVNPAFAKLTYYSSDEAVGQNPRMLKTDLTPDETYIDLWETIASGRTWNGIFANKKKNGEIYWEDAYISPIFGNDDKITHYVAVKVDITRQRETQEQLQSSNDELELYTSFLQHDLRNDLQVLMSNAEAGLILGDEEDPLRSYIEVIMATSGRMKRVLDVFGYPRGIHQTNLQSFIKDVAEQAQNSHPNLEIQVRNLGLTDGFRIPRGRLLPIAFDNLFRNSARFGGDRVNIIVELSQTDTHVQVVVTDDGPGVSEEISSKLFRKGVSTTGSGYGLYLTKKLIEGYNGSISLIESETGEGAKFRIILPLR